MHDSEYRLPGIPVLLNEMEGEKYHILFLGDSITRDGAGRNGFIRLIREHVKAENLTIRVQGAGRSGDRVPDLLARVERDVIRRHPHLTVVYIGINDVWHREKGCGTPEKQYSLGLEELVMRIQSAGSRILLCTPSVIGEKTGEINPYDPSLDVYSEITRTVARKTGCALLDLRRLFRDYLKLRNPGNRDRGILTRDGVHLNDRGNRMVARWIEAALGLRPCGETQSGEKGGP